MKPLIQSADPPAMEPTRKDHAPARAPVRTRPSLVILAGVAVAILIGDRLTLGPRQSTAGVGASSVPKAVLDRNAEAYHKARLLLPREFAEYDTSRFVVFSNADAHWTRTHADHLERAHHQFQRFASRLGLEPMPLRHKLVCIVFSGVERFSEFARLHDGVENDWATGYYSPRHDWVVFYDPASSPAVDGARQSLADRKDAAAELNLAANRAQGKGQHAEAFELNTELTQSRRRIQSEETLVDAFVRDEALATVTHEAVHQLLYHTGVQSRRVRYPTWVSEGLATCFETTKPNQAFGPGHEVAARRHRFDQLLGENQLLPLAELLAIDNLTDLTESQIDAIYHQGYALVNWMSRFQREDLRRYLEALALQPSGTVDATRHLAIFESCFGKVETLERAWLRHEREQAKH